MRERESGPRFAVSQEMQYLTRCNGLAHTWQCEIEKSAFGVVAVMGARICSSRSLFAEISDAAIVAVGNWTLCELECNTLTPGRSALPQTCLHACRLLHSHVLAAPPSMPPSQLHSDLQNLPNVFARGGMGGLRGHLWCQCVWSKCDRGSQGDHRGEHDQRVQVSSRAILQNIKSNPPKYQMQIVSARRVSVVVLRTTAAASPAATPAPPAAPPGGPPRILQNVSVVVHSRVTCHAKNRDMSKIIHGESILEDSKCLAEGSCTQRACEHARWSA